MSEEHGGILLIDLSHAYAKAAATLSLLDSARARGRSGGFLSQLEAAYERDMADLEAAARAFTQAYLSRHASHIEDGEIIWKTPPGDEV